MVSIGLRPPRTMSWFIRLTTCEEAVITIDLPMAPKGVTSSFVRGTSLQPPFKLRTLVARYQLIINWVWL